MAVKYDPLLSKIRINDFAIGASLSGTPNHILLLDSDGKLATNPALWFDAPNNLLVVQGMDFKSGDTFYGNWGIQGAPVHSLVLDSNDGTQLVFKSAEALMLESYWPGTDGMRLNLNESNVQILDLNNNVVFQVNSVTTPANQLVMASAIVGEAPSISSGGTDTDVPIILTAKGSGDIQITNLVTFKNGATAAGSIQYIGGPSPTWNISSATDVALGLYSGGSANINVATYGDLTIDCVGFDLTSTYLKLVSNQPITDVNDNELFKFSATSSAVNELTVSNAATTNDPALTATGGDTNIGIKLATKGSGAISIVTSATAQQSTITSGLVVNNASTGNAADAFVVKALNDANLLNTDPNNATVGISLVAASNVRLLIAGGTTGKAPIGLTSGTSLTSARAGSIEFTTDDLFFTITTGTARKRVLFADPVGGLTSGRVAFSTTNGRLTDNSGLLFATPKLTLPAATTSGASLNLPAGTAPSSPASGDIWNDSTQNTLVSYESGINQYDIGLLFAQTADVTVANTTTETTLVGSGIGTATIPANFFVAGKSIRIYAAGIINESEFGNPGEPRFRIRLGGVGGTLILDTGLQTSLNAVFVLLGWSLEAIITCRTTGSSGTVSAIGMTSLPNGALGQQNTLWPMWNPSTVTLNTTISQAIAVTNQWTAADVDNTVTCQVLTVEVLA